jgi:hypothetical protein
MKHPDKIIYFMIFMFYILFLSGCPTDPTPPPDAFFQDVFPLDNCFIATFSLGRTMSLNLVDNTIEPMDTTDGGGALDVSDNYAYVAGWKYLYIYDISDMNNIVCKSKLSIKHGRDIKVAGDYAYVAEGDYGLCKIDVTDKGHPRITAEYDTPGYAFDVFLVDNTAYVADWADGLNIIDISQENIMTCICTIGLEGITYSAWVLDNTAYVLNSDDGLAIYNVSNPYSPVFISKYINGRGARRIFIDFPYAYLTGGYVFEGMQILDVGNSAAPQAVSVYQMSDGVTENEYICYNAAVKSGIAYLAGGTKYGWYTHARVEMVDVSDPANPVLIAGYTRK